MYRSVVDYTFKNVFVTFCILHVGLPNVTEPRVTNPFPTFPLDGSGCVNNTLINALNKLVL